MKWQGELAEKFGLDFTIIDSDRCGCWTGVQATDAPSFTRARYST